MERLLGLLAREGVILTIVYIVLLLSLANFLSLQWGVKSSLGGLKDSSIKIGEVVTSIDQGVRAQSASMAPLGEKLARIEQAVAALHRHISTQGPIEVDAVEEGAIATQPTTDSGESVNEAEGSPKPPNTGEGTVASPTLGGNAEVSQKFEEIRASLSQIQSSLTVPEEVPSQAGAIVFNVNAFLVDLGKWFIKICVAWSLLVTAATVFLPRKVSALLERYNILSRATARGRLLAAAVVLFYLLMTLTGYVYLFQTVLGAWSEEVQHLYMPLVLMCVGISVIVGTNWRLVPKVIASTAFIIFLGWLVLEANAPPTVENGDYAAYYFAAFRNYAAQMAWNRHSVLAATVLAIMVMYLLRMAQIISDLVSGAHAAD